MKHKSKKLLSVLLSLVLVLGGTALGDTALADGEVTTAEALRSALSAAGETTATLGADISIDSALTVNGTKTLDLNGYGIRMTGGDRVLKVPGGANLTIADRTPTTMHKFTVADPCSNDAGLATVDDTATGDQVKTFQGGYITGGRGRGDRGGGILLFEKSARFIMNGGTIRNNAGLCGGGIRVDRGSAEI